MSCPKNLNPARAAGYLKEMVTVHYLEEGKTLSYNDLSGPKNLGNPHFDEVAEKKHEGGLMAKDW